jgi:hypothetical protein
MISSLAHATAEVTVTSEDNTEGDEDMNSADLVTDKETDSDANIITSPLMLFKARLMATLLDYGAAGMPASSLRKKWKEIWPDDDFPSSEEMHIILDKHSGDSKISKIRNKCKKIKLLSFLKIVASDCCRIDESVVGAEPLLFAVESRSLGVS